MLTPTHPRWHMGSTTHQRLGSHLPVHWWSVLCKERTANSSSPLGFSWSMPFSSERQRHTSDFHSYRVLKGQIRVPASTQTPPHSHITGNSLIFSSVCTVLISTRPLSQHYTVGGVNEHTGLQPPSREDYQPHMVLQCLETGCLNGNTA